MLSFLIVLHNIYYKTIFQQHVSVAGVPPWEADFSRTLVDVSTADWKEKKKKEKQKTVSFRIISCLNTVKIKFCFLNEHIQCNIRML